jgi:Secretion system C-terminal sorting domain
MRNVVLFIVFLFINYYSCAQDTFDFYISNIGNDANAGHSKASPKKTIAGALLPLSNFEAANGSVKIGLKNSDIFNETFNPGYPVQMGTYFDNGAGKNFAIFNGTDVFDAGWARTSGTVNTFEQDIPLSGFTGYGINNVGGYSMVYVFEVDKILERTAPFTARKLLKFVSSLQEADNIPGSFYEPVTVAVNPKTIYLHTSDGTSPNNNSRYRYEVTVRDRAINSTYYENNHFERLWIRGFGAGNGMIPAGANTTFNRMIFGPGAGIHHLGLRGATISNSLFLPGPKNTNGYAVVFYDAQGFGRHNKITNSIFLDIKYPIYTHTSYGSNFGALELDNVIAFADTTESISFIETANNDTVLLNNVYSYEYKRGYNYGKAKYVAVKNSVFIDAEIAVAFSSYSTLASINNSYIRINGSFRAAGIAIGDSTKLILSNSIIHFKNRSAASGTNNALLGNFVAGNGRANNYADVTGNIFICDVDSTNYVLAATTSTTNGAASSNDHWQNNVYILLHGKKIIWNVTNRTSNGGRAEVQTFDQWRLQSGQDRKSLFFDLRNDPRGLKAIFVDPDIGDYTLANTQEANKIKELRAGMISPITCFLKKPTYEEAAKIIMNDFELTGNACRNPCLQNNIRINHQFNGSVLPGRKVQLQWNIEDERSVQHYEIVRSFGNSDFINIGSVTASAAAMYSFTDSTVLPGIEYRYSLVLVTKLGDKCYSAIQSAKIDYGKPISIYPNPSSGKIMLALNDYTGPVKIAVINVMGITVYSKEINSRYGVHPELDLSAQSKGFYRVKVQTDKNTSLQSFILQ